MESMGNFAHFKITRPIQRALHRCRSLKRTASPGKFRSESGRWHSWSGWQADEHSSLRNQTNTTQIQRRSILPVLIKTHIQWQTDRMHKSTHPFPHHPSSQAIGSCRCSSPHRQWQTASNLPTASEGQSYSNCPALKYKSLNSKTGKIQVQSKPKVSPEHMQEKNTTYLSQPTWFMLWPRAAAQDPQSTKPEPDGHWTVWLLHMNHNYSNTYGKWLKPTVLNNP